MRGIELARPGGLVRRFEFRFTVQHENWLNILESELSAVTRQCVRGRRIGVLEELRQEVGT